MNLNSLRRSLLWNPADPSAIRLDGQNLCCRGGEQELQVPRAPVPCLEAEVVQQQPFRLHVGGQLGAIAHFPGGGVYRRGLAHDAQMRKTIRTVAEDAPNRLLSRRGPGPGQFTQAGLPQTAAYHPNDLRPPQLDGNLPLQMFRIEDTDER